MADVFKSQKGKALAYINIQITRLHYTNFKLVAMYFCSCHAGRYVPQQLKKKNSGGYYLYDISRKMKIRLF